MWRLHLISIYLFLQQPECITSCLTSGSVVYCAFQNLRWVPLLPPNTTHLYLEMNRIGEINASSLSGLEELQELDLGSQRVPLLIRDNAFSRQRRLRRLVLGFNPGVRLEPLAFSGLSALHKLDLSSCGLNGSVLSDAYLQPLRSLETLDLFGNRIKKLQPSLFFTNMTNLTAVNLKMNSVGQICEPDLAAFRGKHFRFFSLNSVSLTQMSSLHFDWRKCGNPFRGMSIQDLDLSHSMLGVQNLKLLFRAMEGTKISHLKLSGHMGRGFSFENLPDPERSTFEGLCNSSVLSLSLSKNRIFALQPGVFHALREVRSIDLSHNRLNQIRRNAFQGLQTNLKVLNLSHNLLGEVYRHTFASLEVLQILDLSHNHIGAVGYRSFSGLPNLKVLNLQGNSLRDLGSPASLPHLDYLILDDNKITSVNGLTRFARNVSHLSIQDNRIANVGDIYALANQLERLSSLLFGGNAVKWCTLGPQAAPNTVKHLDLHDSSLQFVWDQGKCWNLFDHFGNVVSLDLSTNQLRALPQNAFCGLTSVESVDLSSNALTYLQPGALPKTLRSLDLSGNFLASPDPEIFRSLSVVGLSMNRFLCSPELRSFLTWLNQTNVTFLGPVKELRCEFPSDLHSVPLLDYSAHLMQQ
uniref:Toll-like receptor 5 n=1 Tax=Oryzias latipes TaxID=8090 RepID=A0A3P9JI24_ORYLA